MSKHYAIHHWQEAPNKAAMDAMVATELATLCLDADAPNPGASHQHCCGVLGTFECYAIPTEFRGTPLHHRTRTRLMLWRQKMHCILRQWEGTDLLPPEVLAFLRKLTHLIEYDLCAGDQMARDLIPLDPPLPEDFRTLPSMPLDDLARLPNVAAIYLVAHGERALYVGATQHLPSRWRKHHRAEALQAISPGVRLYWHALPNDAAMLRRGEHEAIARFAPTENQFFAPYTEKRRRPKTAKDPQSAITSEEDPT